MSTADHIFSDDETGDDETGDEHTAATGTIATHLDRVDEERFVGRMPERDRIRALLAADGVARVLFLHGEGGIGKSAVLRHAARIGKHAGYEVHSIDGAAIQAESVVFDDFVHRVCSGGRPLLVIDRFERMDSRSAHVRELISTSLPDGARVVVASRRPPDAGWRSDGWEHLMVSVPLGPMSVDESRALLVARGLADDERLDAVIAWADGLPLALASSCEHTDDPVVAPGRRSMARLLVDRIVEPESEGRLTEALLVAAIAPTIDAALLRNVLGDREVADTIKRLRALSFVESRAGRLMLHERLAHALIEELRERDPLRERRLRLLIADELHARAVGGDPNVLADLRLLIDDDRFRWGLGGGRRDIAYPDIVRPGDVATLADRLGAGHEPWWPRVVRWFDEGARHVIVIRDRDARMIGAGLWATPRAYPHWAGDDPVLSKVLSHAQRSDPTGNALILLDVFDLFGSSDGAVSPVASIGNVAVLLRCGLPNPRLFYALTPPDPAGVEWMREIGYRVLPELDIEADGRRFRYMQMDHGVDGVIGTTRSLVYRSYGMEPTPPSIEPLVRAALRNFHDDDALATNPLADRLSAKRAGRTDRADALRALIISAITEGFDESERSRMMHAVLEHGYLDDDASHQRARSALFLSRSAYFRWLGKAIEHLTSVIGPRIG